MGFEDSKTLKLLKELYNPWDVKKIIVNTRTAEMIKYANNSFASYPNFRAANEIANLAQAVGNIDALDVMEGVFSDKRWSPISKTVKEFNQILPNI